MSTRGRITMAVAAAMALALGTVACSAGASTESGSAEGAQSDLKTITIGFNSGPYEDEVTNGIQPILEKEGYTVEHQSFTDGIQVNAALDSGDIQANVMQHPVYMEYVNEQRGFHNVALVQVPGPPMGLFAGTSDSLEPAVGASVAVPSEPSNLYRALLLLQKVGWITVSDSADSGTASLNDITSNPYDLDLQLLDPSQAVRALQDVDYAAVQGNFVVSSGLKLTDALALEDLQDQFRVVVAVKSGNEDTQWAKDLKAAYESTEFQDYITSTATYDGYSLPDYFTEK